MHTTNGAYASGHRNDRSVNKSGQRLHWPTLGRNGSPRVGSNLIVELLGSGSFLVLGFSLLEHRKRQISGLPIYGTKVQHRTDRARGVVLSTPRRGREARGFGLGPTSFRFNPPFRPLPPTRRHH